MRIEEMRTLFKDVHTEEDIKKILNEHEGLEDEIRQMDKDNLAELSDDELENIVGGISGGRSIAMILASLTIISSSALIPAASGNFISPVTVSAAEMTTDESNADIITEASATKDTIKDDAKADISQQEISDEVIAQMAAGTDSPEMAGNIINDVLDDEIKDVHDIIKKINDTVSDDDKGFSEKVDKSVREGLKWYLKKLYKRILWWL